MTDQVWGYKDGVNKFLEESSGGSSSSGAFVHLAADDASYASGDTIVFDTIDFDPDGYFDPTAGGSPLTPGFVIPAGKAGLHIVGLTVVVVSSASETCVQAFVSNGGAQANPRSNLAAQAVGGGLTWRGGPTQLIDAAEGDILFGEAFIDVDATVTLKGGVNATIFWITKL